MALPDRSGDRWPTASGRAAAPVPDDPAHAGFNRSAFAREREPRSSPRGTCDQLLGDTDSKVKARNAVFLVPAAARERTAGNPVGAQLALREADAATALVVSPALPEILDTRAAWLTIPAAIGVSGAAHPARGLPATALPPGLAAALATATALRTVRQTGFTAQGRRARVVRQGKTGYEAGHEAHPRDAER